jgi:phosphoribosylamine--glycine ligase
MRVLLVGGGGREHALAWRLARDEPTISIIAAPGNPGIAEIAECLPVPANDLDRLIQLARDRRVDMTLVGPEGPLAAGIVDRFRAEKLPIFGPTRAASEIETSKAFSKGLMQEANVPTARAIVCSDVERAKGAAREFGAPIVVKASGLAAGKGVVVCQTIQEADAAIEEMLIAHVFGVAGQEVLIEEFMSGEELSVLALTDGERVIPLTPAQDHKRLLDGDRGPNTGGMGAYAPVSIATDSVMDGVIETIFRPTLAALAAKGRTFTGVLYAGLMLTPDGPRVVEFNCRFGDPETQAVLPVAHLSVPFLTLLETIARGEKLPDDVTSGARGVAVTTVLAAKGYPGHHETGAQLYIPNPREGVLVFHAGTTRDANGSLVTSGGRVLGVTGIAASFRDAQKKSVTAARSIAFQGKHFRTDIGWRELSRSSS